MKGYITMPCLLNNIGDASYNKASKNQKPKTWLPIQLRIQLQLQTPQCMHLQIQINKENQALANSKYLHISALNDRSKR